MIAQVNYLPKALELKCSFPSLKKPLRLLLDSPKGGDANIVDLDIGQELFSTLQITERFYYGLGWRQKTYSELLIGKKLATPVIDIFIDRQTKKAELGYLPLDPSDPKKLKTMEAVGKCEPHKSLRKF